MINIYNDVDYNTLYYYYYCITSAIGTYIEGYMSSVVSVGYHKESLYRL